MVDSETLVIVNGGRWWRGIGKKQRTEEEVQKLHSSLARGGEVVVR